MDDLLLEVTFFCTCCFNIFSIINNNKITDLTGKIFNSNTLKDLISNKGIHEAKDYAKNNPGDLNVSEVE